VHLAAGAVPEQVVQLDLVQTPGRPAVELVLIASQTRLTVDLFNAASAPRASARVAATSRTDRPRTTPAITNDSNALVLVTPAPKSRHAKDSVVPRSFGRSMVTGPAVVLIVVGQSPLRAPGRASSVWAARC